MISITYKRCFYIVFSSYVLYYPYDRTCIRIYIYVHYYLF